MRDQFGDRSVFFWMSLLSAAEMDDGNIHGTPPYIARIHGQYLDRTHPQRAQNVLLFMVNKGWLTPTLTDGLTVGYFITKYWKYHKRRNPVRESNSGQFVPVPNPPNLSEPNLIKNAAKLDSPKPKLDHKIKEVADRIYNSDPQKFARLVVWIKSVQKQSFKNEHIALALESFESYAKDISDWYPYLSKVVNRVRNQSNGSGAGWDAQKFKNDEKAWLRDFLRNGMK